jgi:hypothetical protein
MDGDSDVTSRLTALLPGIVTAGLFGLVTGNMTFALVSVMAALVTVAVWRLEAVRRRRRRGREIEARRRERADHVAEYVRQWDRWHRARASRLRHEHPRLCELPVLVAAGDERLWQWRAQHHHDVWQVALTRVSETVGVDGTEASIVVEDVPRLVELAPGVVVGVHGAVAMDVVRAMLVRLSVRSGPADWRLSSWPRSVGRTIGLVGLPHSRASAPHVVCVIDEPDRWVEYSRRRGEECVLVVAVRRDQLPASCTIIIDADHVESMDTMTADAVVRTLTRWTDPEVPDDHDVNIALSTAPRSSFAVVLGDDDNGAEVSIDIVCHGPHAVVVGCTGSGKSELLLRWITEMAATVDSSMLNILMVDYKGGSTGDVLARLPHTVGVLTDLDQHTVARAVAALRCEFRDREERLRTVGARGIDDCAVGTLPRLLVVVDEVAALRAQSPEFLGELLSIAQRGRSLGIHLLLATQRPQSLTSDIVANSDIRVALRVLNAADSVDVVGSPVAASFPRASPGRAAVSCSGGEVVVVNTRTTGGCGATGEPARPLWCAPLPSPLVAEAFPGPVAVLDDIERRDQPCVPSVGGWWSIVGDPRTRAVALASIAERVEVTVLSADDCDAEAIHLTALALEARSVDTLVLDGVDDIMAFCLFDAASRSAWARLEKSLSTWESGVVVATCGRESGTPLVIRDRCSRTLHMLDTHGGFETLHEGRNIFGRFVKSTNPWTPSRPPRFPGRIERDDAFAVFADTGRAVEMSSGDPWYVLIIGESGSGRTTALRSLADHWGRERAHLSRRLMVVDHDEVSHEVNLDDDNVDVIAAVDPLTLRNSFDHWAHAIRRHRTGLLLGRAAVEHADLLGAAPPPRPYAIVPGRGEWVQHGSAMGIVQVTV